jgi:hypothetical protein
MALFSDFIRDTELAIISTDYDLERHPSIRQAIGIRKVNSPKYIRSTSRRRNEGLVACMLTEGYGLLEEFLPDDGHEHIKYWFEKFIILNVFGDDQFQTRIREFCMHFGIGSWIHKPSGSFDASIMGDAAPFMKFFDIPETVHFVYDMIPEMCIRAQHLDNRVESLRSKRKRQFDGDMKAATGNTSTWLRLHAIRRHIPFRLITDLPSWEQERMLARASRIWTSVSNEFKKPTEKFGIIENLDMDDPSDRDAAINMMLDYVLELAHREAEENFILKPTMHILHANREGNFDLSSHRIPFSPFNPEIHDAERLKCAQHARKLYQTSTDNGNIVLGVVFTDTVDADAMQAWVMIDLIQERSPGHVTREDWCFQIDGKNYIVDRNGRLHTIETEKKFTDHKGLELTDDDCPF